MALLLNKFSESPPAEVSTLQLERTDLYRRRFRAIDSEGNDLAIDLDSLPKHNSILCDEAESKYYQIEQTPEEVCIIPVPSDPTFAAKIGWYLGNRHIPIEVTEKDIILENFPTLTDSLDRIGISYRINVQRLYCAPHSAEHRH